MRRFGERVDSRLGREGGGRTDETKRATELLDRVGLKNRISHRPGQLSEASVNESPSAAPDQPAGLLLADEPTGNLDRTNAEAVGDLLLEMNKTAASRVDLCHAQ